VAAASPSVRPSIISNIFIIFIQKYFGIDAKIKWLSIKHDPLAHSWVVGRALMCLSV